MANVARSRAPKVPPQVDLFGESAPAPVPAPRKARAKPREVERTSAVAPVTAVVVSPPPDAEPVAAGRRAGAAADLAIQFAHAGSAVVRDTFSMPGADHARIEQLRLRAARGGRHASKSEIVRAGLVALEALAADKLAALLGRLEKLKPGRRR